jgi:oxygen-independent coproporphyrinogen-3 oxidase
MHPDYIGEIIRTISENFRLSENVEVTLETNPGTVEKKKLQAFKENGINRISIGIQSFDDNELKFLTRIHDKKKAIKTVENAHNSGFENISIDLIFSLPNQTLQKWKKNLEIAVALPIKHISAYSLILEKGTVLNKMVIDGKVKISPENHDAQLYKYSMDYLENNGFYQYEISNFSKDGFECLHNKYYWEYYDYLGFGTSAHSYVNGKRWWNFSSLVKYISEIQLKQNAVRGEENLTNEEMLDEFIMLGLRSKGINLDKLNSYSKQWYFEKRKIINSFIDKRYLQQKENILRCTQNGYMICDEIINKLL